MNKKYTLITIAVIIIVSGGLFLKSQKEIVDSLPVAKVYTYNVSTTKAKTKILSENRNFLAQLLASDSAMVASKFTALIKEIHVKESMLVKKGKLLISLDDSELRSKISSLKKLEQALNADASNAKTSLQRNSKLLEAGAISQEKYDNSNALYLNKLSALANSKNSTAQLYDQLTYLNIKAPFSGRIGTISADAGSLAIAGKPILSINSADQKLIFSYVETSQSILKGQKVFVDGKEIGVIGTLYDDAKNSLLVAEVKILKPINYRNKGFLNIDVQVSQMSGCSVPLNAILHKSDGTYIMTYKEDHFESLKVDILLQNSEEAILNVCPTYLIATASEAKLALLPTRGKLNITEEK
ncbi:MAG: efflux RND transporter periplasmic adaptor subunit [Helicobacteraceae bacterium]|nr:efflux RND transporter periplasmic adaptor subunit [Helicobacteraceae bacterium]